MYLLALTLVLGSTLIPYGHSYSKCCDSGEDLIWIDSAYECVEKKSQRLEILAEDVNFLGENFHGECVDVSTDFFIFNVSNGKVVGKRPVTENIFPKCCPLNYTYNSVLHSCEERNDADFSFTSENFVKVGLPNCKLIVDYDLDGDTDFEYDLIGGRLKRRRNSLRNPESFCIDETEKGSYVVRECKEDLDVCDEIRCVKKCCPDGQSFIGGANCFDTYTKGLNMSSFSSVERPSDAFAIIHNRTCSKIYMLKEDKYTFNLNVEGVLSLWQNSTSSYIKKEVSDTRSYCVEHTKKSNIEGYFFFMCFSEKSVKDKFSYTIWPKIMSCICLAVTIAVYLMLNETRNVFGKILVNYCVALFLDNAILSYAQMSLHPTNIDCKLRSFSIIFFTTATFSWSNVMCCDIWWTFGSAKRTVGSHQRRRDLRKLFLYFLYGWGVPTMLTLLVFFFYAYRILPYAIQPFMAVRKCFFENRKGNYAHALFFNLPHLIIQLVNTVLFMKTIIYCLKVKNEINKIDDTTKDDKSKRFQKDKERLFLIIKLSVIMGVSFMFEVVSAFFDMSQMGVIPKYIEIIWDSINCSQGIFIFIIFIYKKKIYRDFLLKFKLLHPRSISTSSIHTQSTTTSNGTSMKVFRSGNDIGRVT